MYAASAADANDVSATRSTQTSLPATPAAGGTAVNIGDAFLTPRLHRLGGPPDAHREMSPITDVGLTESLAMTPATFDAFSASSRTEHFAPVPSASTSQVAFPPSGPGARAAEVLSCMVCLGDAPATVRTACCGAAAHARCLAGWLMRSGTCPHCRASLDDGSEDAGAAEKDDEDDGDRAHMQRSITSEASDSLLEDPAADLAVAEAADLDPEELQDRVRLAIVLQDLRRNRLRARQEQQEQQQQQQEQQQQQQQQQQQAVSNQDQQRHQHHSPSRVRGAVATETAMPVPGSRVAPMNLRRDATSHGSTFLAPHDAYRHPPAISGPAYEPAPLGSNAPWAGVYRRNRAGPTPEPVVD